MNTTKLQKLKTFNSELSNGMNEICVPLLLSTSEAPSMTDDSNEFSYPGSEISLDMSEYLNEAFDKYLEDFYYSSDDFSEAQNSSGIEELEPADSISGQQDEAKYHSSQSSSENDKPTVFQTEAVIEHVDPDSPLQTDRSSGQSSRSWGDSDKLTVIGNEDTDSTDNIPVSHEDGVYYAEVVYL